jgi:hypothetical protein
MRKHRLSLADLIDIGGEDLRSADPKRRRKALHVEKCWALMARLQVKHIDLETMLPREFAPAAVPEPTLRPRRQRHRGVVTQAIDDEGNSSSATTSIDSNEINDLAANSPVEAPAPQSEQKLEDAQ